MTNEGPKRAHQRLADSPELRDVARRLVTQALARQDRALGVRETEQLRRALATAGDALLWDTTADGREADGKARRDLLTLTTRGAKAMAREIAKEVERKQTEISRLADAAASARMLAEDPDAKFPAEITYGYTARDCHGELITKTVTLTVTDASMALGSAGTIERSMAYRGNLAELMIAELERKQERLDSLQRDLRDFLESTQGLLVEVISNLP